jgi:succinate dehydrogenase / fumarate reductase membrane anchor subunit
MRERTWWAFHVGSALVVLGLLGLHMAIMHVDMLLGVFNRPGTDAIEWANVADRARQGAFMASYVTMLGVALFHGLYGLRTIAFELNPGPGLRKGLGVLLAVVGVALFGLGTWAAWASFALARAS